MKLLDALRDQVKTLGRIKHAWFTTFGLGIPFFETHVLPALLSADAPLNRMDYEGLQSQLVESGIDLRVFCDMRMLEADQPKRTAMHVHGMLPTWWEGFDKDSLFHPKVIFLQDTDGRMVLGAGSANLTISGWGRNQEVFVFRSVSHNEQYQQVNRFFAPLARAAGFNIDDAMGKRRFGGDGPGWRFAHSFEKTSFLQQLLADPQADSLAVWSPYFSRDLAGLLARITELAGRDLQYAIVPDRVNHRYVRTKWSSALEEWLGSGALSFHDRPSPRADNIEMTHAKLWLASGNTVDQARLAVGSWNCTEPGCASFERRNIEAGILLDVPPKTRIVGWPLVLTGADFASDQLLEEQALGLNAYDLPFELQVCFDWQHRGYSVQGQLHQAIEGAHYGLRLPGVAKEIPLCWKARRSDGAWPLEPLALELADNEALLTNHSFEIWRDGQLEFRGLVQELGTPHRPAQGYDSLKDLLNDLIDDVAPGQGTKPRLRQPLRHDDPPDDEPAEAATAAGDGVSYFRLFRAFEQLRKRLDDAESMDALEMLLFVHPGSVQELVAKVGAQISAPGGNAVFNWFLWQETQTLYSQALKSYDQHRGTVPPDSGKWASLRLKDGAVSLPPAIGGNAPYMRQVRELCNYER